jgi:hypothetical protein
MSNLDPTNTLIYKGDDVTRVLADHPDCVEVVERINSGLTYSTITVHIMSPYSDAEVLEWIISIASPKGRRTLDLRQRVAGGSISITDAFK